MTEQVPGLELFISSEKAVQGAAKFRDAVESAAQAVERIGAVVDRFDGLLDRLSGSTKTAAPALKKLGDSAAEVGAKLQQGGEQAQRFEGRMTRLGGTLGGVARQFTLLLGAAGAISGISAAVAAFSEYEDKLRILGSIAGATGEQLQKLETAAVDLSRNSRFTPREGIDGLTELSRAGLSAQDAITALKPTADLARVGLLGLSDSSAIVTKTLTQFKLGADQASRVADVLAAAANGSNANVGTLADALAKTGPVARQFGVSLEDTVAALALLADNGIAANIAGTGLQRILIQLRSPTEEAQRALLGLGLAAEKVNPERVGLIGALQNLRNAGVSVQDSVSLVGTEFASLFSILTEGVGTVDAFGTKLLNVTGTSTQQAAAGADTLAAAFADLRNASEQFAVSASRGGIGQALTDITRTGAEVIRVLAGDKKAMEEAGAASKLLATGLQLAAVAGAAFAAAKVATVISEVASKLQLATVATAAYAAVTGSAVERALVADKAFKVLNATLLRNPFVLAAAGIAAVITALTVFGEKSDTAVEDLKKQQTQAKSLEEEYARLVATLAKLKPGAFSNRDDQVAALRSSFAALKELGSQIEALKGERVPIEKILGLAELQGVSPRLESIRVAFDRLKDGTDNLSNTKFALGALGASFDKAGNFFLTSKEALDLISAGLATLDKRASDAALALAKIGEGNKTDVSSAVRALVAERERELELAKLTGAEREKAILIAEAEKRAGQGLNDAEKQRLATLAQAIVDGEKLVEQKRREKQEAEKAAQLQRDLPKNLAELQKRYQDELTIAQATGLQRELIRAAVEAENDAKEIGLALDSQAFAELKAQAEERARLAFAEKQGKKEARVDKRQDETLRQLEQEEQLLRLSGAEREKYRVQIEAENEARQAGLVIGTAEYADFIKRKQVVGELARAQEQLGQLAAQFAGSWTNALEQFIIDGGKARDVAKALYQDLARLALRQTAGTGFAALFQQGGQALAGLFAGGASPTAGPTSTTGGGGITNSSSVFGGNYYPVTPQPRLTGDLIPAMVGTVIDQPTILQRGGSAYSVAEGAKTTPEAIFRLARDERGNLGVAAVGGGGDTINMSFPGVRNAADAKAMRSTFGQQVRAIRAGDKRGRRGRRPAGE